MSTPAVFDVSATTFQKDVVERSRTVPVLLDFWADWCTPCKTFAPMLERVAEEYGGAFLVGKVDVDRQPELAQAFRVQSVPFIVIVQGGRPVDAFAGAVSEPELRRLLDSLGVVPGAGDPAEPEMVPADRAALEAARAAALANDAAGARDALDGFPEESELVGEYENLLAGLVFLEADLTSGAPAAELLATARTELLGGEMEAGLRHIVESVRVDRAFGDGLARQAMRFCQGVFGESDTVDEHRRQMATLLY